MTYLYADDPLDGSTLSVSGGRLTFLRNSSTATATLSYGDTSGAEPSEQLHLNLNNTRLFFNVALTDVHSFLSFSIYRHDGSVFSSTLMIDTGIPKSYIFGIFNDPSFDDVSGMQVSLPAPFGNDIELNSIMVEVPEPSTYAAMFGMGLLGFSIVRKRIACSKRMA